jgi:formiminoglutamate deiminase
MYRTGTGRAATEVPVWWAEHAWLGGATAAAGVVLEVKGDRLAAVIPGVSKASSQATVLPGLTLPGLANGHSHAFHRALRGRAQDRSGTFWSWRELMYSLADRLDPDAYHRLARATYTEMVLAGYTAVGEFHYLHHGPGGHPYADPNAMGGALVAAAAEAGLRLTLLDTCYLEAAPGAGPDGVQMRFSDGSAGTWAERVSRMAPDANTVIGAAVHSVRAVPPAAAAEVAAWARAGHRPLHAHVSEQPQENDECVAAYGATPLEVLAGAGAVDGAFTAVHGTHLSRSDVALLGRSGGGCCLCPTTERDLGDGIGPVAEMAAAGVTLSLGSDSHAVVDPFEEARALEMDARLAARSRGVMTPPQLLGAATQGGMAALGWDAGRLEAGRLADFVTIRTASVRTAGADPASPAAAVFAAGAADVDTVVVGGRTVVQAGVHRNGGDAGAELAAVIGELWR